MSRTNYFEGYVWKTYEHKPLTTDQEDKLESFVNNLNKDISYTNGQRWNIIIGNDYIAIGKFEDTYISGVFKIGHSKKIPKENKEVVQKVIRLIKIERVYDINEHLDAAYTVEPFQMIYYDGGYYPFEDKPDWESLFK